MPEDNGQIEADVTYRITENGIFYYPQTEKAWRVMRSLLCVHVSRTDAGHEAFVHSFPTLKLKEE